MSLLWISPHDARFQFGAPSRTGRTGGKILSVKSDLEAFLLKHKFVTDSLSSSRTKAYHYRDQNETLRVSVFCSTFERVIPLLYECPACGYKFQDKQYRRYELRLKCSKCGTQCKPKKASVPEREKILRQLQAIEKNTEHEKI